jgi:hypothetical protein
MAAIFAFKCRCCGEVHEGSPSFGFLAPDHYAGLSEEQKAQMGMLTEDFCTITHEGGTDRFVRAVLEVPIHGVEEPFLWGVWVSLSEQSFNRYRETFREPVVGEGFFGWVCNSISVYPYEHSRPADVVVQGGSSRPKVVLHRGDPEDDQLVLDQANGISIARAQELAELALHEA